MNNILMTLLNPDTYVWLLMALMAVLSVGVLLLWIYGRRKWLKWTCTLVALLGWYILLYGTFVGVAHVKVRQVEFASKDLPAAFDGYRIVQIGDLHVGTFTGWREQILKDIIDTANAQKGDLIVFTGDLQNKEPSEIVPFRKLLAKLKAKDGIISVLGNHDYPMYTDDYDEMRKAMNMNMLVNEQEELGWRLLANSYRRIRRGHDRIYIAGMENDGEGHFPQRGNLSEALIGLNRESFVVMLEHDPTSWRRKILPHSHCQLTLSGHTHGGHLSLFGWSPAAFRYREWGGMYYAGDRALNVSTGVGGVIPIRFCMDPEIVVITLKKK